MKTDSSLRRLFPNSIRHAGAWNRRSSRRPARLVVERCEERRLLATVAPIGLVPPAAVASAGVDLTRVAVVQPAAVVSASQTFSFGFKHVNEAGADRYLISSVGMRKYSEWQSTPITYWGPSANGTEGRLVYKFEFAAPAQSIRLKAESPTWNFFTEPGGVGRGASAIEVSRDGQTWISLRNNLEPRNWGGDWSYNEQLPSALAGASSLWVRMRFLVENAPNSSYTVAQFARSTAAATANVFGIEAQLGSVPTESRVVQLSRVAGEGYARLVQSGIYLEQGKSYRFTVRMRGNVTLQDTDHIPEFWGNGRIFDGTAKRFWTEGDWTYCESTVSPPVSGFYELKLALWSRQSLALTGVSLRSLSTGAELVKNGQFLDGFRDWYTHGGTISTV